MLERDKWFYFAGGKSAQDLEELESALRDIPDSEFVFHVNTGKNDFANWVEGVLDERDLAAELRTVMERKDTLEIIKRHLHRMKSARPNELKILPPAVIEKKEDKSEEKADGSELVESPLNLSAFIEPAPTYKIESAKKVAAPDRFPADAGLKEHELGKEELDEIVEETKEELQLEERKIGAKDAAKQKRSESHKFVIKEFIYGFILGLIFGLIMLGALFNIKVCY
jgi:hypothetical protein